MLLEIQNFTLEKAKKYREDDKTVPVRVVSNRLNLDKEDDVILPQAFDKDTVDFFLREGIMDWHHESKWGKTAEDRAIAIIGKPIEFAWEDGLPVVYAKLTKENRIVKESIIPNLEAGQSVLGASVGGRVTGYENSIDETVGRPIKKIFKIYWDHLAIAARPYVMNSGSEVSLAKAYNNNMTVSFSDLSSFAKDISLCQKSEGFLYKAMEMGSGTDSATFTGATALRFQNINHTSVLEDYLEKLRLNRIAPTQKAMIEFFTLNGLSSREAYEFSDHVGKILIKS